MEAVVERQETVRGSGGRDTGIVRVDSLFDFGILAGKLDGCLVGLRAGVAEEGPRGPGFRCFHHLLRQACLRGGVVEVGNVRELSGLLPDGCEPRGMPVPEGVDSDPGGEVEVGISVCVP